MTVYWTHTLAYGGDGGVAWIGVSSGGNGDLVAAGGYITAHSGGSIPSNENGSDVQSNFPLIASYPVWDTNHSEWDWQLGFAVPNGVQADAHVWGMTA